MIDTNVKCRYDDIFSERRLRRGLPDTSKYCNIAGNLLGKHSRSFDDTFKCVNRTSVMSGNKVRLLLDNVNDTRFEKASIPFIVLLSSDFVILKCMRLACDDIILKENEYRHFP